MILFTLDINTNRKNASKTSFVYLIISVFLVIFGAIYEKYSHGVYSYYMIYAFSIPLVCGTLVFSIISVLNINIYPNTITRNLYHSAIATLTVGSLVKGALNIYGTTNQMSNLYWLIGGLLLISAVVAFIVQIIPMARKTNKSDISN